MGGYGKEMVINDVTFQTGIGDFLGIIGPNGSGKSTLLKLMSKVLPIISGSVSLGKDDIVKLSLKEFCRKAAFVSQDTLINFSFSVEEIVMMGRIPHLKRLEQATGKDFKKVAEALEMTDTSGLRDKLIDELSSGERQRVIIAKALAQEPTLLFLDEPTSHLDIGHQIQVLDLLKKLNRQNQLTIVMVIHDLNLASEYCSRILLLDQGKIFKQGTPQEVLTYQNIESVYKTVVLVKNNPINSKPYVVLVSGEK